MIRTASIIPTTIPAALHELDRRRTEYFLADGLATVVAHDRMVDASEWASLLCEQVCEGNIRGGC